MYQHQENPNNQSDMKIDRNTAEMIKALIKFNLNHNDQHITELADLLDYLPKTARRKMLTAIGTFEAANTELGTVLDCLVESED